MTDLSPIDLILRGMTDAELREHNLYMAKAWWVAKANGARTGTLDFIAVASDNAQAEINRRRVLADGWLPPVFVTTGGDIQNPEADFSGHDVEVTDHWPTPMIVRTTDYLNPSLSPQSEWYCVDADGKGVRIPPPGTITVTDLRGDTHDAAARARAWPNT